jgi:hypothetical protein
MRTTLAIDDDVLHLAKEIAAAERRTAGEVISDMFRRGLASGDPAVSGDLTGVDAELASLGIPVIRGGSPVTNAQVNALREELGI